MLKLSADGFLSPGCHRCTIDDLFVLFVRDSTHRQQLFEKWQAYNKRLSNTLGNIELIQWIDGSFVTSKLMPNDIDFVTFIPSALYEPNEHVLIEFYSTVSLYDYGLDAYICPVYPIEHSNFQLTRQYKSLWSKRFKKSKDTVGEKGFLELIL